MASMCHRCDARHCLSICNGFRLEALRRIPLYFTCSHTESADRDLTWYRYSNSYMQVPVCRSCCSKYNCCYCGTEFSK